MSTITPRAIAVLERVKRYGVGTWPADGRVISPTPDHDFTRAHSEVFTTLLVSGHLALDDRGNLVPGLLGEHELRAHDGSISESRRRIAGTHFQVVTEGWELEAEASRVRALVLDGLGELSETEPVRFARIVRMVSAGVDDEALEMLIESALHDVIGRDSAALNERSGRIGVRALG